MKGRELHTFIENAYHGSGMKIEQLDGQTDMDKTISLSDLPKLVI